MFELWKVMGRVMLDKTFLQELRRVIGSQVDDPRADNEDLLNLLVSKGAFTTRFERGEVQYWLRDEVFVDTLEKLESVWTSKDHNGGDFKEEFEKAAGLYAAVALALFDKLFRQLVTASADLAEFGFEGEDAPVGKAKQNQKAPPKPPGEKRLSKEQKTKAAKFLKDERVKKLFSILERLGWNSACREGASFDPDYEHEHDCDCSDKLSSSMSYMKRPRRYR